MAGGSGLTFFGGPDPLLVFPDMFFFIFLYFAYEDTTCKFWEPKYNLSIQVYHMAALK